MKKITGTTRHFINKDGHITCEESAGTRAIIPDAAGRVVLAEGRAVIIATVKSLLDQEYPQAKAKAEEPQESIEDAPKRKKRKRKSKNVDE